MVKNRLTPMQSLLVVVFSFLLASIVNVYPMGFTAAALRPMTMMMVLVFWLIYQPRHVGVIIAFIVGLSADLLLDTRLGQQAFAAVVMAFSIRFMGSYLRQLDFSIAWMMACAALSVFRITLWVVQYISQNIFIASGFFSLLVSLLTWPVVYLLFIRFSR